MFGQRWDLKRLAGNGGFSGKDVLRSKGKKDDVVGGTDKRKASTKMGTAEIGTGRDGGPGSRHGVVRW